MFKCNTVVCTFENGFVMIKKDGGFVKLRVSSDEKKRWDAIAAQQKMTLSDLIRSRMDTVTVDRPIKKKRLTRHADPLLLSNVGRVGSNLNQLARWANTYKDAADSAQILLALVAIEQALLEVLPDKKPVSPTEEGEGFSDVD